MRILRLELERYGHFTDKRLDFRRDACLHVVYGPNEAGKSSSLDAITDLLFGFPHITRYDFLHEKTKLGVGASIEGKDGTPLTFKRRKGTKNTLLDAAGKPLAEEVLLPFLASVSKTVFQNAFGLSKETLRSGAEEMLRTGGEAGSSLIAAASGLKGLSDLRKQLDAEASAIFAPTKAQHRTFYQARDRQEEAAKSIRQLELRDRDLKERRARIAALAESLAAIKQQRSEIIQRREFLTRQREIAPLLLAIAANEDLLTTYEHLPPVDASRIVQLRTAYEELEHCTTELQRFRNELTGAVATADGFVVDAPLIALGPAIDALVSESGNYSAERAQLPRVQGEADQFRNKLEEFRVRLGLPSGADVAELRPSDLVIARVKERIAEGQRLENNAASLAVAMEKEQATHDDLVSSRENQAAAGDSKTLRDRLARLMPTLNRLPEAARLERAIAKDSEQLRERAAQLSPAVVDVDALAGMSLLSADTISEYVSSAERLARDLATQQAARNSIEQALPALRSAVEDDLEPLESTPERIAEVRSLRTSQWTPLRSVLLKEAEPFPAGETASRIIALEKTIDSSDRLSDDAVRNADRLAHRASALKRLEEEEARLRQASDKVEAAEAAIAAYKEEWRKLWELFGIVPGPARKMEPWRAQVRDLLERREQLRENQRGLGEITAAYLAIEPALKDLARAAGIAEADKLPASVLVPGIQEEIDKRDEAWRKAQEVETLVRASEDRLAELESDRKDQQNAEREWTKAWVQVMSTINLPAGTSLDEASAALDVWQQVPSAVAQLEDRTRRVQGMKRDMQTFEARTTALCAQLGELEMGLGADATIKTIAGRLSKALQTESMARVANQRVTDLGAQIVTAEANLASAQETFDALSSGIPDSRHRSEQIAELEAREAILKTLQQQRQTLVPLSRGKAEAELRSSLGSFDDATAAAEIEELSGRHSQLGHDENEVFANQREAENQLAVLENGTGAEVALQMKKNAETQLVQCARDWCVKRIAHMLLSHAIERFRSDQEAPLLRRASELFSLLTAGSFTGVEQEYDESDNVQLVGRRDAEHTVCIEGMSEGARDQLYLALRLAYLEDYAAKSEPLPFIGDDLLTNFDDERTSRGLAALAAVGARMQPILFTHHQRVVDLAQDQLGSAVDVIRLGSVSASSQSVFEEVRITCADPPRL